MMITENNYEEYFLLYIDDELSSAERNAVEAFIGQHPQYAAMISILLQTKLSPDNSVSFTSKEALYKNENSDIGINNYEEYFLLYTDNELSEAEKESTERFVLQHPQLQPEFTLLQQTKLLPDTIEFTGKEKLYKQERKRRVLPLYITRMSVAAAVAGIIAFTWQFVSTNNKIGNNVVAIKTATIDKPPAKPALSTILPQQKIGNPQEAIAQQKQQKNEVKAAAVIAKSGHTNQENKTTQQDIIIAPTEHEKQQVATPGLTQTAMQKQPVAEVKKEPVTMAALKPLEEVSEEATATQTALSVSDDNSMAQPAVYKELKPEDDQTLYVGAFQLNKNKVNGFLKSASHLLGGKAKQNTD